MSESRTAEILAIGDELVHGQSVDTNSAWLARELELCGLHLRRFTVVRDDVTELADAIVQACRRSDVVIATGGLGPTLDDLTRQAAAQAMGVELVFDDESWRRISTMLERRGRHVQETNRRQAMLPSGARVLDNDQGTAPGFRLELHGARLYSLPGVPREMRGMFRDRVLGELGGLGAGRSERALHVMGCSEAELGARLEEFMRRDREPRVGVTAKNGLLSIRVVGHDDARVGDTVDLIRPLIQELLLYEGTDDLATHVGQRLIEADLSIAIAESCTGGLLASALTDVPGISAVLRAGFVAYSNDAKIRDLDVPGEVLASHGAVSLPVVEAMARGAATRTGSRLALSISGIAGPGGGSVDRPVGTVCFGVAMDGKVHSLERRFGNFGRAFLRQRSVLEALHLILAAVRGPG